MNAPEAFAQIFRERWAKPPQPMDVERWKALYSKYEGGKLIDLGCLDSLIPVWAKRDWPQCEIWGLDQSQDAILALASAYPEINYTHGDVYDTTLPTGYFDYVVAGELIEHLEHPEDFIKEAFRILRPGGVLALSTPKEEEKGGVDEHAHLWSFSRHDIAKLVEPYTKPKFGVIPSWIRRRVKYSHPYLLMWATKR